MKDKRNSIVSTLNTVRKSGMMNLAPIALILLMCMVSPIWANTSYAQLAKVSINERNSSLRNVFDKIEAQTELYFMYDASVVDVNRKVNVVAVDKPVDELLDQILKGTNINYQIENKQIVLNKNAEVENSVRSAQQSVRITGKITEPNGEPILGATIVEKGTTNGTTTDMNGSYAISVKSANATLVVSFIGMKTQEVAASGRTTINVVLQEDVSQLDEVVVVGYGTMMKKDLTGSVSSISADNLKDIPVSSTAQALTGKLAGVQITTTEGSPDAEIKIRVRGGGSITQDNSPLYIVDGFPVARISDIPPSDIQSIDVL
jgi:hypothetical protein